ncbi:MAG: methyltransferase domain-containing protein [Eubacteriales bacterium]|nr:methyltransferase domain-containing protein [Eubacteriales bacterium]MDD4105969.1 methyltransferase domain-containing protein [Eubacteriales bacterium]MDD4711269.1 methyltransferase domain-containing protein [Eubacteriales bacterium]NLO15856.1 class I SAM-dependent methyltransferase [Clostridiales bacterium]
MQTPSQVYRNVLQGGITRRRSLGAAQKAVARWALVDDYQALLDLSCRDSRLLSFYSQRNHIRACGLCGDTERAAQIKESLPEAEIMQGSPYDIPWQDNTFHAVMVSYPLGAYRGLGGLLSEIRRILRKGGQLLIALPIFPFVLQDLPLTGESNRLLGPGARRELLLTLEQMGYEDVSIRHSNFGFATLVARRGSGAR